MKEQSFNRSVDSTLPVVGPNFDDERTLLSARRVVPLARIDAKRRNRRHWLLGGAFALAMVLGAASALLASYLKLRNVQVASESTEIENPVMPVAVVAAEPVTGELPPAEETTEAENIETTEAENIEEVTPDTPTRAPVVRRRAPINRTIDLVRPRVVRDTDENAELERIRESILIDDWQERRARRAARRERRNRVDHHDRDLSNLDEIFEGRRRRPY